MWLPGSLLLFIGGIPPYSRWEWRQTFHQSFPSLARLSLSLTDAGALLIPSASTHKAGWRHTRGIPDGIPNWFLTPYHHDLWFALFLWWHPGCNRVVSWNVSQARTTKGSIHLPCAHSLSTVLTSVERRSHCHISKLLESFIWSTKSSYYQRKSPTVLPNWDSWPMFLETLCSLAALPSTSFGSTATKRTHWFHLAPKLSSSKSRFPWLPSVGSK